MAVYETNKEFTEALSYFYLILIITATLLNIIIFLTLISPFHERRFRDYILMSFTLAVTFFILFSGSEEFKGLQSDGAVFSKNKAECKIFRFLLKQFKIFEFVIN